MAACARGNADAFETLLRRHADGIVSYLRGLTGDIDAAKDLAQETFIAVWESRAAYAPRARVGTWLHAIARNRYVDWVRKRANRPRTAGGPNGVESPSPPPEAAVERRELIARALELLAKLPDTEREVIVLRILEGMPYAEISDLIDVPENVVRVYASRALARLREAMAQPL
jgi:RNA polymerase sigma-70 factor (ECF subfamily)